MVQERILVVDDDEALLRLLSMRLSANGFAVTTCATGEEALALAKREMFDLALTDLRLPDRDGLSVLEGLKLIHPDLPVLLLTAHGSIPNAVEAMQKGAFGYLTKPFDNKELEATLEKALAQQRMSREIQRLKLLVKELYGLENVVARSPKMQVLLDQVARVAETDATICLLGETGTGKEVIARVIHCNSRRARGPFIGVNCGAIPESLFESELFGHVKGAFTGAQHAKRGLVQSAQRGTLFLDEIAEMPLTLQGKLLRAIQEPGVLAVGAQGPTKAVVLSSQDMSTPDLLPSVTQEPTGQVKPLTAARDEFEQNYLKAVLQLTGGNISRAAQIAGRYRADFYKLLKKHGLHPGDAKEEKDTDSAESA